MGEPSPAAVHHREALAITKDCGIRYEQARALDGLASAAFSLGDVDAARTYWREALALHQELGTPEADDVVGRLADRR